MGRAIANRCSAANVERTVSPFEAKLVQSTRARNTLEHNYARLAVVHLGLLKRRTGNAISAT